MNKPRIVVVDDTEANRYAKTRILEREGFEVFQAGSGAEAFKQIREHNPDVIVLDVKLPDISGYDVCRKLKTDPDLKSIPVIHTSASYVRGVDQAHGLNSGAENYLTEPHEPVVLIASVRSLLRLRMSEQERERVLARERTAREDAETANRAKDDFLATLSHELRTPLTAIKGWTRILLSNDVDKEMISRGLTVIDRNVSLQEKLIDDLLDTSRIISGKLELRLVDVDPKLVFNAAIDSVSTQAVAKKIQIHTDFDPTVGMLTADRNRLQQVFWNLLSNAIKFTPDGGDINAIIRRVDGMVQIQVRDSGCGISQDFLPHVFDRFRQADSSTTRSHGGLGLGLAIVKQLVELHSGKVRVISEGLGKGATFIVDLPPRPHAFRTSELSSSDAWSSKTQNTNPDLSSIRVLVVEDDRDTRELIAAVLGNSGARVTVASGALMACDLLAVSTYDIIVSDISMPEIDGIALITRVRAMPAYSGIPALALTAHASKEECERIKSAGFQECLTKPTEPNELINLIASLMHII